MATVLPAASAQSPLVQWSKPVKLSFASGAASSPNVVGDRFGHLHVFWSQKEGGGSGFLLPQDVGEQKQTQVPDGNTIYYRYWNGSTWSKPVDLFFTGGPFFKFPVAVIDDTDQIHLVWTAIDGIHYSSAPALGAGGSQLWKRDVVIASGFGDVPDLAVDHLGNLHLAYSRWVNSLTGDREGQIYYLRSSDHGRSWSAPIQVSAFESNGLTAGSHPRLAVDDNNTVHLVWGEAQSPDWVPSALFYSRSTDQGKSWTAPLRLASRSGKTGWNGYPEIALSIPDEVHIVWVCGEAHRCSAQSMDGGKNWTKPQSVFGDLLGWSGWDSLISDGAGKLYWIAQLRYPAAIYCSYWDGTKWLDPPNAFISSAPLNVAGGPVSAITDGNKLNLVLGDTVNGDVWYIQGIIPATYRLPEPVPSPTPTKALTTVTATSIPPSRVSPTSAFSANENLTASPSVNNQFPIVLGIIPGLILVSTIVLVRVIRVQK